MKKNDWILIAAVVVIAALFMGFHFFGSSRGDGYVEVQVDGELFGTYDLAEECTVEIDGTNRLQIAEGAASMIWADCPDQVCVRHKAISRDGESIICLPNKVVVSIYGSEEDGLDAVTN